MELNKILSQEEFFVGDGNLSDYYKKLTKLNFGALMYCESGEAIITIDLNEYRVVQNTNIFLIPNSIFSISHAAPDFKINYFIYSIEMFHTASFRLEHAFIHFIYENPCYTHSDQVKIKSLQNLIKACANIYHDKDNRFRNDIAQNLLQIFFFDTYDKVQRLFTDRKPFTSNRKEEIFKRFLDLIHVHCVKQRDVAWYAAELCISTRYLASIVRDISGDRKSVV